MPNPAYNIERGILIPLETILLCISIYQAHLGYKLAVATTKRYIHLCLLFQAFFLLPHEMDPWGLFNILPLWFTRLAFDVSSACGATAMALIIISHFQAHYSTLQRQVPAFIEYSLIVSMVIFWISTFISDFLIYVAHQPVFILLQNFGTVQFQGTILVTDLVGFAVIYRLMKAMKEREAMPKKLEEVDTFKQLMCRMYTFHAMIGVGVGGTFLYLFSSAIRQAATPPSQLRPTLPNSPNDYILPGNGPAAIASWLLYTWWAWIPRDYNTSYKASHRTTEQPGSRTHTPTNVMPQDTSSPTTHNKGKTFTFGIPSPESESLTEGGGQRKFTSATSPIEEGPLTKSEPGERSDFEAEGLLSGSMTDPSGLHPIIRSPSGECTIELAAALGHPPTSPGTNVGDGSSGENKRLEPIGEERGFSLRKKETQDSSETGDVGAEDSTSRKIFNPYLNYP